MPGLFVIFGSGCALLNHAPMINSLTIDDSCLCLETKYDLSATATDADEDELHYDWQAASGEILGDGADVTWKTPSEPGDVLITLTVTDARGKQTTETLNLSVMPNRPPRIDHLTGQLVVCKDIESLPLECLASDPDGDELSYHWTATGVKS